MAGVIGCPAASRTSHRGIRTGRFSTSAATLLTADEKASAATTTAAWDGKSLSQTQFMERDTVLVTDWDDNVID